MFCKIVSRTRCPNDPYYAIFRTSGSWKIAVTGPFHATASTHAGDPIDEMLYAKFGERKPFNRQSENYAREGIELDASTHADFVGACTAMTPPCRSWP
jgi:hypothetical protein